MISDREQLRLKTQEHMEPRLPQWRADMVATLTNPDVSDEDAWAAYGRAAYLLVRDSYEMAQYGEVRTHGYRDSEEVASGLAAHRAPMLAQWRQDATDLLGDKGVTDKEAFTQMSKWAYSLSAKSAHWAVLQYEREVGADGYQPR